MAHTTTRHNWLSVNEILADLKISRRTWQTWRELGRTPECVKLPNGKLRVHRDMYEAWLKSLKDDV